jgi:hypothetical protein
MSATLDGVAKKIKPEPTAEQRRLKSWCGHITRQLNERCGDLIRVLLSAEPAEPEAAVAVADGMRRHEHGSSRLAQRLSALGALRPGMTPQRATAVLSMMTSPANWRQLTQDAGWTFDEAEAWLSASLAQLLLEQDR